jgi:glycosyltransferase involved in cell wall biosynthesis
MLYYPDNIGGAESVVQSLAEGMKARGIDVAILTTTDKPGLHQNEVNGIRIWRAGLRNIYWYRNNRRAGPIMRKLWHLVDIYNPLMSSMIKEVVSYEKPTVASVHNLPGFSLSTWSVLKDAHIPIVQVLHDHYLLCPASTMFKNQVNCVTQCFSCKLMRLPHKAMSHNIAAVVGVSSYIINRHLKAGYFRNVLELTVIHNTRTPQELGLKESPESERENHRPLRFGFIGMLIPTKGVELLLQTYKRSAFIDSQLFIAGVGDDKYVERLKRLGEGCSVTFMGHVKPVDFYQLVDVLIVPSLWNEPLGAVIMEAMIFGKPVIGSDTGGIAEMVVDYENGLLFNPDEPDGLLRAMERLYVDNNLRKKLSRGAIHSSIKFVSREDFLDKHVAIYLAAENAN